jgi:hypothetical protein
MSSHGRDDAATGVGKQLAAVPFLPRDVARLSRRAALVMD